MFRKGVAAEWRTGNREPGMENDERAYALMVGQASVPARLRRQGRLRHQTSAFFTASSEGTTQGDESE